MAKIKGAIVVDCNCSRHRTLQRLQSLRSGMSATCNIAHRQRSE